MHFHIVNMYKDKEVNKNVWRESVFDIYFTEFGTALTTILPILFQYCYTFPEIIIIATGPCITNQLRDVNTIYRRSWYIPAHIWKIYDFKIEIVPFIIHFSTELTTVVKFEAIPRSCRQKCQNKFVINVWCKIVFDIYLTEFGTALTTILPILFQHCYTYCYSDSRNLWAVMKAGGRHNQSTTGKLWKP
jgi:hypothetical protein